jgi:hypothetical protein
VRRALVVLVGESIATYCEGLSESSLYRLLNAQGDALFLHESFADLFEDVGGPRFPRALSRR